MKTTLSFERETKGTFVFKDDADNAPIPSLYIKKSAFRGKPPQKLIVEFKEG